MRFILCFLLISVIITGCKSSEQVQSREQNTQQNDSGENPREADLEEVEELYWQRTEEAKMNYTEADVKFMEDMIAHHAQALIMSDLAPENNASPEVQRLAARIINAQKDEIKTMQTWLRDRGEDVPKVHIDGLKLMIHGTGMEGGHHDHSNMAGMLSQEQLKELSEAKGDEFDRLFLKYMIQHHEGAVTMVKKLISTDGAVQDEAAFRLATDINVDQKTEIARMKLMLQNLKFEEKISN